MHTYSAATLRYGLWCACEPVLLYQLHISPTSSSLSWARALQHDSSSVKLRNFLYIALWRACRKCNIGLYFASSLRCQWVYLCHC